MANEVVGVFNDSYGYDIDPLTDQELLGLVGITVIDIDVQPTINVSDNGVIPVAVLTTIDFDALQVDASTLKFGPDEASIAHSYPPHPEDVDDDFDTDLMLHFRTQETGVMCEDTELALTGELFGGELFSGVDTITTVGCEVGSCH